MSDTYYFRCTKCGCHGDIPYSYFDQKPFCSKVCKDGYIKKTMATKAENEERKQQRRIVIGSPPPQKSTGKSKIKVKRVRQTKAGSLGKKLRKWFK